MSTNAPTSRCITYMYCHVDGLDLEVEFFFSKKYFSRKFPIFQNFYFPFFFQTLFRFPSCFILWIIFQFIFLLALYFESSSNLSSLYTFFFIYKGDNSWETQLELFQRILSSFERSSINLRKSTWIILENSFNFWVPISRNSAVDPLFCLPRTCRLQQFPGGPLILV